MPEPTTETVEQVKSFSQAEVDALIGRARSEEQARLFKAIGVDDETQAIAVVAAGRSAADAALTETQRLTAANEKLVKDNAELTDSNRRAQLDLATQSAGVKLGLDAVAISQVALLSRADNPATAESVMAAFVASPEGARFKGTAPVVVGTPVVPPTSVTSETEVPLSPLFTALL